MVNFDASRYPDTAIVKKAVLAIRVENNVDLFAKRVQLRGRQMTGDTLQSLGSEAATPQVQPGWVQFDVTAFVARAINERRPNIQFELSLPCGRDESELTTISLLAAEPRLVVEFK
jgi:hypothetical protein